MKEQLAQIKDKLQELNERLTASQKISIGIVITIALAIILGIGITSSRDSYSMLVSRMSAEDSAKVVEILKKERIPYKLVQGGSGIMVPDDKVLDTRLKLASNGLPKGSGVGFEIFDQQDITTLTEFTEHVNMIRAIQGELSRTIEALEPVDKARVHIVVPKESMFVEDQKDTTASIMLNLKTGYGLNRKQVKSIVHLVASSVEGLQRNNIAIIDNNGRVLHGDEEGFDGITGKQIEYKRKIERGLEENILKMILPVVGDGKARVTVNADLDFDKAEKKEEKYNPDVTAVRSETKLEESTENVKDQQGGVVGAQANLPGRAGQAVNNADVSRSNLEKSTTNFEINKTIRKVIETVGSIKKVNASVVLDGVPQKDGDTVKIVPIAEKQLKEIEELVQTAIGFDETRGDRVVVSSIPFRAKEVIIAESPVEKWIRFAYRHYIIHGLIFIIVLLLVAFLVVRPLTRSIKSVIPAPATPEGVVMEGFEDEEEQEKITEDIEKTAEELELERLSDEIEVSMGITMSREQLVAINFARKNLDVTTKILKKWMKDN